MPTQPSGPPRRAATADGRSREPTGTGRSRSRGTLATRQPPVDRPRSEPLAVIARIRRSRVQSRLRRVRELDSHDPDVADDQRRVTVGPRLRSSGPQRSPADARTNVRGTRPTTSRGTKCRCRQAVPEPERRAAATCCWKPPDQRGDLRPPWNRARDVAATEREPAVGSRPRSATGKRGESTKSRRPAAPADRQRAAEPAAAVGRSPEPPAKAGPDAQSAKDILATSSAESRAQPARCHRGRCRAPEPD